MARREPRADHKAPASTTAPSPDLDDPFPIWAEILRKVALGAVAALIVARAFYPSEDAELGTGLAWVLCVLGASAVAVASSLLAGSIRFRWAWTDLFVAGLVLAVGWSAGHALDRRPAITMAWEWGAIGLLYLMARNLPRTAGESIALAGVIAIAALAVGSFGLYQVGIEFEGLRQRFLANPNAMLLKVQVEPGTPLAEAFRQRLLYSNEPFSTFALANSLAGFLVAPLVLLASVAISSIRRPDARGGRWGVAILLALPILVILACLILTKSRSAYLGLVVGLVVVAIRSIRLVSPRALGLIALGTIGVVGGMVAVGVATRQLDVQILTEARKSLGYRWEYWQGAWGIITKAPPAYALPTGTPLLGGGSISSDEATQPSGPDPFWWGVGPANFSRPYLLHKLPQASEEVQDPHNLVLEIWAESGFWAMALLVAAIGSGVWSILGRSSPTEETPQGRPESPESSTASPAWIWGAGALGWILVASLGRLNPFDDDLTARWFVLGLAGLLGAATIWPAWRSKVDGVATGLGAGALALAVSLLAAGGIGIPSVAILLWISLALGLNLRADRGSGRLRLRDGLGGPVALACAWAMVAGTFYGAVVPGWKSDAYSDEGDALMAHNPPNYEAARNAYALAVEADRFAVRPWLGLADLEYRYWRSPEGGDRKKPTWTRVLVALDKAVEGKYRDPDRLAIRRRQAMYARKILSELPEDVEPVEVLGLRSTIVRSTRMAARVYPTSATIRAELAQASADMGMFADAAAEGRAALDLDALNPHADKKLRPGLRPALEAEIPRWDELARKPPPEPPGSKRPKG